MQTASKSPRVVLNPSPLVILIFNRWQLYCVQWYFPTWILIILEKLYIQHIMWNGMMKHVFKWKLKKSLETASNYVARSGFQLVILLYSRTISMGRSHDRTLYKHKSISLTPSPPWRVFSPSSSLFSSEQHLPQHFISTWSFAGGRRLCHIMGSVFVTLPLFDSMSEKIIIKSKD